MTVISSIITDAYRETNQIAIGKTPSDPQITEALSRLLSLIDGVYGWDAGKELKDWMVGYANQEDPDYSWAESDWQRPVQNSRILLNHTTAQTIYFPALPDNGARMMVVDVNSALATHNVTLNGNGRLIDDAATASLTTNGLVKTWLYNADTAEWQALDELTSVSEMPFPARFDDYFIIRLAGRLSPRYGRSLSDASLERLRELTEQLEAQYRQSRPMPAPSAVRRLAGPSSRGYDPDSGHKGRFGWMM